MIIRNPRKCTWVIIALCLILTGLITIHNAIAQTAAQKVVQQSSKGEKTEKKGMDPEFPPRAYFNEFNSASLNLLVIYWYHPADYWGFMQHSQKVNLQIMQRFEEEDIKFAFPTTTTYLTQADGQPLQINVAGSSQLTGGSALA